MKEKYKKELKNLILAAEGVLNLLVDLGTYEEEDGAKPFRDVSNLEKAVAAGRRVLQEDAAAKKKTKNFKKRAKYTYPITKTLQEIPVIGVLGGPSQLKTKRTNDGKTKT